MTRFLLLLLIFGGLLVVCRDAHAQWWVGDVPYSLQVNKYDSFYGEARRVRWSCEGPMTLWGPLPQKPGDPTDWPDYATRHWRHRFNWRPAPLSREAHDWRTEIPATAILASPVEVKDVPPISPPPQAATNDSDKRTRLRR